MYGQNILNGSYMSNSEMTFCTLKILHTSIYLFNKYGFYKVGIDRIIENARVSKSAFYYNFQSKEKLIEMCLSFQKDTLKDKVFSTISYRDPIFFDKLKEIFFLHVDLEGFYYLQFKAIFEIEKLYPKAYRVVIAYRNWLINEIYKLLLTIKSTASVEDAYIFLYIIDGSIMQLLDNNSVDDREHLINYFFKLCCV